MVAPVRTHGLIVDVGMHTGVDTEFYLAKGFHVLAVEANPILVAEVTERLQGAVSEGRLEIVNVAIADEPGEVEFHVSDDPLLSSTSQSRAGSSLGIKTREIRVRADTLDAVVAGRRPYYVKIDIEGSDAAAVRALERFQVTPKFVSFEADLNYPDVSPELIRRLGALGYQRFKFVNQALNGSVRCPKPALEGDYVDERFTTTSSGPFGDEAPGEWLDQDALLGRLESVCRRQAVRASYGETGRIFGVRVGRVHRQLKWLYKLGPVAGLRRRWAAARGVEVGGWFDIHARRE